MHYIYTVTVLRGATWCDNRAFTMCTLSVPIGGPSLSSHASVFGIVENRPFNDLLHASTSCDFTTQFSFILKTFFLFKNLARFSDPHWSRNFFSLNARSELADPRVFLLNSLDTDYLYYPMDTTLDRFEFIYRQTRQ